MGKKITWIIAHQPAELLLRVANDFKNEVERQTNEFEFEILTEDEYATYYNDGIVVDTLDLLAQGKAQISQTYTYKLNYWNKNFEVIDMPFLFSDHDHAARVFEGPIGKSLLKGLETGKKPLKGLAFTYSGGYRIFVTKNDADLSSVERLKDLPIKTSSSQIAIDTIKALGAIPISLEADDFRDLLFKDAIVAAESTYPRYLSYIYKYVTSVLDVGHSLYTTTLLSNFDFWNELSDEHKEIMENAARSAAKQERDRSVADAEEYKKKSAQLGVNIVSLTDSELQTLKEKTSVVYSKWEDHFLPGLINAIRSA